MQEEDGGDVCLAGDGASGTQVQAQAQACRRRRGRSVAEGS